MKENPILIDKDVFPDNDVLKEALNNTYIIYDKLITQVSDDPYNLTQEWRYYKDGHSWLCKVVHKKKTVFWISIFDGYFKIAFYLSAKLSEGILDQPIDQDIKADFQQRDFIGKVKPLIVDVVDSSHIDDILKIALYKKKN